MVEIPKLATTIDSSQYQKAKDLSRQLFSVLNDEDNIADEYKSVLNEKHDTEFGSAEGSSESHKFCYKIESNELQKGLLAGHSEICFADNERAELNVNFFNGIIRPDTINPPKFNEEVVSFFSSHPICKVQQKKDDEVLFECTSHQEFAFSSLRDFQEKLDTAYNDAVFNLKKTSRQINDIFQITAEEAEE